ncbi:hypothetical protein ACJMK2_041332 [Sinanodonta woodiana]|uniref:N-acetyltransferase domain-containing protein n=2 Tax=Sinanodonta woodiana TaxID=1069815 RepID=A0ABD3W545_SINWO
MSQISRCTDGFDIREVEITSDETPSNFRRLARQVSGESFDVPHDSRILFGFLKKTRNMNKPLQVAELAFQPANMKLSEPGINFDSDFYHQIQFLFVKGDYQGCGYGTALVEKAIDLCMWHDSSRPIRVQAAHTAVRFFEKQGFKQTGDRIDCIYSGSNLFRKLYNMEKQQD